MKGKADDEPVLFIDAVHPTWATEISYDWIRKGHQRAIGTTGSRTRLNIMGTLNLKSPERPLINEYPVINTLSISRLFNEIRKVYPGHNQTVNIILDGTRYYHTQLIAD